MSDLAPLRSMTGFSSGNFITTVAGEDIEATVTLKSLNGRYFDLTARVPFGFSQLETEFSRRYKPRLRRGNIFLTISFDKPNTVKIQPGMPVVDAYLKASDAISRHFDIPGTLTLKDLIQLPHVFESQEQPVTPDAVEEILTKMNPIVDRLIEDQAREGNRLRTDLLARFERTRELVATLPSRVELVMEKRRDLLMETCKKISEELQIEAPAEMYTQLVGNALDKIDIHEEITRLESHLEAASEHLLSQQIEKGKKLDFILQELFREINTVAAKSADSDISSAAIAVKVELEKAREQAHNIV